MTEYSPAKTGEYQRIFPNFHNCARCEKDLKDNRDNSRHLGRKYARLFVLGHYLFLPVRFSEQIMSADKYPSIFSRQMTTIVYIHNTNWCLGWRGLGQIIYGEGENERQWGVR